jgi:hypothetical protein
VHRRVRALLTVSDPLRTSIRIGGFCVAADRIGTATAAAAIDTPGLRHAETAAAGEQITHQVYCDT